MSATRTTDGPAVARKATPARSFRVKIDSPLAKVDLAVEAKSADEARKIVLGWVDRGTTVSEG